MARTRAVDYEDTREGIVDRAAELFAGHGFARTSINDIAVACGSSKARIYHYFDSKEAVLAYIMTSHIDALIDATGQAIAEAPDDMAKFRAFVRTSMAIYAGATARHVVLMNELGSLPDDMARAVRDKERELLDIVRTLLNRIAGGRIAPKQIKTHSMLFFGMMNWTYTWYRANGDVTARALADDIVDIFMHGFLSKAG